MKAELSNFPALFPNAAVIHSPGLSPTLCAEFNLIQKAPSCTQRHLTPVLK